MPSMCIVFFFFRFFFVSMFVTGLFFNAMSFAGQSSVCRHPVPLSPCLCVPFSPSPPLHVFMVYFLVLCVCQLSS